MKEFLQKRKDEFEPSYIGWIILGLFSSGVLIHYINIYPTNTFIIYNIILFVLYTKFLRDDDLEEK